MKYNRLIGIFSIFLLSMLGSFSLRAGDFLVVIDPGHGGHDTGTVHNGGREKDIVLDVSRRLGALIKQSHSGVKVLYTRDKDVFIGLQERADFANRNQADLFISIHVNSAPSSSAYGTETYVLGLGKKENNLGVAMRENKAILLEKDYQTIYKGFDPTSTESYIMFEVMQDANIQRSLAIAGFVEGEYKKAGRSSRGVRQEALWVLSQTAMPAILTELGFVSNGSESSVLKSSEGRAKLAGALHRAFSRYYDAYGKQTTPKKGAINESLTARPSGRSTSAVSSSSKGTLQAKPSEKNVRYRIQLMAIKEKLATSDRRFKNAGSRVSREPLGRSYVYMVGSYTSLSEAKKRLRALRRNYKGAYIVRYRSGKREKEIH